MAAQMQYRRTRLTGPRSCGKRSGRSTPGISRSSWRRESCPSPAPTRGSRPSRALLVLNTLAYAALAVMTAARLLWFPSRLAADVADGRRAPGLFAIVAATSVLGVQYARIAGDDRLGFRLLVAAAALWIAIVYAFFARLTVRAAKPGPGGDVHGGWLLAAVATQSLAVLGTAIAVPPGRPERAVVFASLVLFLLGAVLYMIILAALFGRLLFVPLTPFDVTPPYWITMGAAAISTLAGAQLLAAGPGPGILARVQPFVAGLTLLLWATGSWWIPLLAILGAWRHLVRRVPVTYSADYWSLVFPLGMYGACSYALAAALHLPFLFPVSRAAFVVAFAAWLATFAGLVRHLALGALRRDAGGAAGRG
jgi:tellurite resistance protein TehA-like permease